MVNATKNGKWLYYDISKNENFILRKPYSITELYDSLCNSGTLSIGDIVNIELGDKYVYNATCRITECSGIKKWRDNNSTEVVTPYRIIVLFDIGTLEDIVIKYHYA